MDFFGPREVLIAVGVLVVLAILLDGVRRVKRNRYERLHMSPRKMQKIFEDDDFDDEDPFDRSQFPSGGSRVVGTRDDSDILQVEESIKRATARPPLFKHEIRQQNQFDLDEPEQVASTQSAAEPQIVEPVQAKAQQPERSDQPEQVLVIHLMAPKGEPMSGQLLLNTVVDNGLRYGEMKIFHRHVNDDGSGDVLFSMANAVNPGTFDLKEMPRQTVPGVTLFMALDDLADPEAAFTIMLNTVDKLAMGLQLNVLDESRSSMTRQTIDHYRQRAREVASRRNRS